MKLCQREITWFDAVVQGKHQFVQTNLQRYKRQYDQRPTKKQTHQGWAAIHYAVAYGQEEIFKLLLPEEYDLLTDKQQLVFCQRLNKNVPVQAGSSIIHLLIVTNRIDYLRYIIHEWNDKQQYKDLCGCKNDDGDSAMALAIQTGTETGYLWCCNEKAIRNEIKLRNNRQQNILMLICYYGRAKYRDWLEDMLNEQKLTNIQERIDQLRQAIMAQDTQTDMDGNRWMDYVDKENDYCTRNDQQTAFEQIKKIFGAIQ